MLDVEDRPLCILQRLHLDELSGGMRGLYEMLATSKRRGKNEPPEKIHGTSISKQDLCAAFGLFVEKLEKMRETDDRLRYAPAAGNSGATAAPYRPAHGAKMGKPQAGKRRPRRRHKGTKRAPAA